MRILAIADTQERALSEHFDPKRWGSIDLIISCGDLDPDYLDLVVSRIDAPLLYVRGNHDTSYHERPPGGCENIDGRVRRFGGLRIAGLEGSRWYGGRGIEYSDRDMVWRCYWLRARILLARGIDILVTHAPPVFVRNSESSSESAESQSTPHQDKASIQTDRVHAGFPAFNRLIQQSHPIMHLHGHTHLSYGRAKRESRLGTTCVIDCYGAHVIEIDANRKR